MPSKTEKNHSSSQADRKGSQITLEGWGRIPAHPRGIGKDPSACQGDKEGPQLSPWRPGRYLSPTSGALSQYRLMLGAKHTVHWFPHMQSRGCGAGMGAQGSAPLPGSRLCRMDQELLAVGLWHRAPIWWWLSPTSLLLLKPAPNLSPKHTKPCRSWRHRPSWGKEVAGALLQDVGPPDT